MEVPEIWSPLKLTLPPHQPAHKRKTDRRNPATCRLFFPVPARKLKSGTAKATGRAGVPPWFPVFPEPEVCECERWRFHLRNCGFDFEREHAVLSPETSSVLRIVWAGDLRHSPHSPWSFDQNPPVVLSDLITRRVSTLKSQLPLVLVENSKRTAHDVAQQRADGGKMSWSHFDFVPAASRDFA